MHLSALHNAGPLPDLTTAAKRMSTAAALNELQATSDTFQQALTAHASEDGGVPATADEAAGVLAQAAIRNTASEALAGSTAATPTYPASTESDSLLTTLRSYSSASQGASQAYQEYAKAWGGRVVHGEVELPPLSIYLE